MSTMHRAGSGGSGFFMASVALLANLIAIMAAFLGTPYLHAETLPFILRISTMHYGHGYEVAIFYAWFVIAGGFVFALTRAVVGNTLVLTRAALLSRLF